MTKNINIIPKKIIELEIEIKLLDYLKREKSIDDNMYNHLINKLLNKIEIEKNKIDETYIKDLTNYNLITI